MKNMQTLKVKYRQHSKFGCGSYSLANLFDNPDFIEIIPEKNGERIADLNRKMDEYEPALFVNTMYMTNIHLPQRNKLIMSQKDLFSYNDDSIYEEEKKTLARPFLMVFARGNNQLHTVGLVHDLKTKKYYLVDSCEVDVLDFTLIQLMNNYRIVTLAQFTLWNCEDPANFLMLHRDDFAHIFK